MSKIEKTFRSGEVLQASDLNDMVEGINQIESEVGEFGKPIIIDNIQPTGSKLVLTTTLGDDNLLFISKKYGGKSLNTHYVSIGGKSYRIDHMGSYYWITEKSVHIQEITYTILGALYAYKGENLSIYTVNAGGYLSEAEIIAGNTAQQWASKIFAVFYEGLHERVSNVEERLGDVEEELTQIGHEVGKLQESVEELKDKSADARDVVDLEEKVNAVARGDFGTPDYGTNLPLMCGQPMVLFGAGTPQEAIVPDNWKQYDADTDEGYNWNGLPSALGQRYINVSASSRAEYIAVRTSYDKNNANYDVLKWLNL